MVSRADPPERKWMVRREGTGEDSVIHVHDRISGTVAFRMTQDAARALISELSKVTLMPPKGAVAGGGACRGCPAHGLRTEPSEDRSVIPVSAEGQQEATALSGRRPVRDQVFTLVLEHLVDGEIARYHTDPSFHHDCFKKATEITADLAVRRLLSGALVDAPNGAIGPVSPPVDGPARTVEVSDRTGRTDPDVP